MTSNALLQQEGQITISHLIEIIEVHQKQFSHSIRL
jgi:hypothetical protein